MNPKEIILPIWLNTRNTNDVAKYIEENNLVEDFRPWELKYHVILDSEILPERSWDGKIKHKVFFLKDFVRQNKLSEAKNYFTVLEDEEKAQEIITAMNEELGAPGELDEYKKLCESTGLFLPNSVNVTSKEIKIFFDLRETKSLDFLFDQLTISELFPYANHRKFQKMSDSFPVFKMPKNLKPETSKIKCIMSLDTSIRAERFVSILNASAKSLAFDGSKTTGSDINAMTEIIDCDALLRTELSSIEKSIPKVTEWKKYKENLTVKPCIEISVEKNSYVLTMKTRTQEENYKLLLESLFSNSVEDMRPNIKYTLSGKSFLLARYMDVSLNVDIFLDIMNDYLRELIASNTIESGDFLVSDERNKFVRFYQNYPNQKGSFILRSKNERTTIHVKTNPATRQAESLNRPSLSVRIESTDSAHSLYMLAVFGCFLARYYEKAKEYQDIYAAFGVNTPLHLERMKECSEIQASSELNQKAIFDKKANKTCMDQGCGPVAQDGKCTSNTKLEGWTDPKINYKRTCQNAKKGISRTPLVVSQERLVQMIEDDLYFPEGSYTEFPKNSGKFLVCPNIGTPNKRGEFSYISVTRPTAGKEIYPVVPCCAKTNPSDNLTEGINLFTGNLHKIRLRTQNNIKFSNIKTSYEKLQKFIANLQDMEFSFIGNVLVYNKDKGEFVIKVTTTKKRKSLNLEFSSNILKDITRPLGAFKINLQKVKGKEITFDLILYVEQDAIIDEKSDEIPTEDKISSNLITIADESGIQLGDYAVNQDSLKSNDDLTTSTVAKAGAFGLLPVNIGRLLKLMTIKNRKDYSMWRRMGVGEFSDVSIINCVVVALAQRGIEEYLTSKQARNLFLKKIKRSGGVNCIGLIVNSTGIKTLEDLERYIKTSNLSPREILPLIEYLWEINIILISRDWNESPDAQFVLPYHKNSYFKYKNYERTIIVYEHSGKKSSQDNNVCELVYHKTELEENTAILSDPLFNKNLLSFWLRSQISFVRNGENFSNSRKIKNTEFDPNVWSVIPGDSELIGLRAKSITFFPDNFLPPLPLPVSEMSIYQDSKSIKSVVRNLGGEILAENSANLTCKINSIIMTCPIIDSKEDKIYRVRENQKIARILLGYVLYQFSLLLADGDQEDINVNSVIERSEEDYTPGLYSSELPPPFESLSGSKVKIFSQFGDFDQIKNKIEGQLFYWLKFKSKELEDYKKLRTVPNFYNLATDYKQHPDSFISIFKGSAADEEISVPLFDGKLYAFPMFNTKTYYLRNKKLTDGKVCLARTFNLKAFESRGFDELKAWLKTMPDMTKAFKAINKLGEYETSWASKKSIFVLVECESEFEVCYDYEEDVDNVYRNVIVLKVDTIANFKKPNMFLHGLNLVKYPNNNRIVAFIKK